MAFVNPEAPLPRLDTNDSTELNHGFREGPRVRRFFDSSPKDLPAAVATPSMPALILGSQSFARVDRGFCACPQNFLLMVSPMSAKPLAICGTYLSVSFSARTNAQAATPMPVSTPGMARPR